MWLIERESIKYLKVDVYIAKKIELTSAALLVENRKKKKMYDIDL